MIIKLKKPLTKATGEKVTELNFDLESVTGYDYQAARKAAGNNASSEDVLLHLAAKAADVATSTLLELPLKDHFRVLSTVNRFFGDLDSELEETPSKKENQQNGK